jgi:hypothetical protein
MPNLIERPHNAVIDAVSGGLSLTKALALHNVDRGTFLRALADDDQLRLRYARATEIRADIHVDDVVEIADTDPDAQRARNRIDARKWAAAKLHPSKYSDRVDINVTQTVDIDAAMRAADARVLATLRPVSDQRDTITDLLPNESGTYEARPTDSQSVDADPDIFS